MEKNYPEGWEIFDAVISNSTWGSGPNGGPVWVLDFRYENVASLLSTHPWLSLLKVADSEVQAWLNFRVNDFIFKQKLGNVLHLSHYRYVTEICTSFRFYANAYLLRKIAEICSGGIIKDDQQRLEMSEEYLLRFYSHCFYGDIIKMQRDRALSFEAGDFYTVMDSDVCGLKSISDRYPRFLDRSFARELETREGQHYSTIAHTAVGIGKLDMIKVVYGPENYLPMLVYDLMESWQNGEPWPMAFYQKTEQIWDYQGEHKYKLELDDNLQKYPWHRRFLPKQKWEVYKG